MEALVAWVENDDAPETIVATKFEDDDVTAGKVTRQRPLCLYPKQAKWDGKGDVNAAASWNCV